MIKVEEKQGRGWRGFLLALPQRNVVLPQTQNF